MAHVKRYYGRLKSRDGFAYQAWLLDDQFVGEATPIDLSDSPVFVTWGRRGAWIYSPILGSIVDIEAYKLVEGQFAEFVGSPPGRFRLQLVRGATHELIDAGTYTTFWLGKVTLDDYEDDTMQAPSLITLSAIDALGDLKDIAYMDTSGPEPVGYTGRHDLIVHLQRCLAKTGLALPFTVAARWFPQQGSGLHSFLAEADSLAFYDKEGKALSCYDVLRQICLRLGCLLFQWMGRWYILQRELLTGAAITVYNYDAAGTYTGSAAFGAGVDVAGAIKLAGKRTFRQAFGTATIKYNHLDVPGLMGAVTFGDTPNRSGRLSAYLPDEDPADYWGTSGGALVGVRYAGGWEGRISHGTGRRAGVGYGILARRLDPNKVMFISSVWTGSKNPSTARDELAEQGLYATQTSVHVVQAGTIIAFVARVRLTINDAGDGTGVWPAYFALTIGGSDYYLTYKGRWETTTNFRTRVQWVTRPGLEWGDRGLRLGEWYDILIVSDPMPVTGPPQLWLWGTSDRWTGAFGTMHPEGVEWDDADILIVNPDGTVKSVTITEAVGPYVAKEKTMVELVLGEGPAPNVAGRLTWGNAMADQWTADGGVTRKPLDQLTTERWLRAQLIPLEQRFDKYQDLNLGMGQPAMIDGQPYLPTFLRKNLYDNEDEVELVAVREDPGQINFYGVSTDDEPREILDSPTETISSGGAGGSTSVGILARYLSTHNPAAYLNTAIELGTTVTELRLDPIAGSQFRKGDTVVLISPDSGRFWTFEAAQDEVDGVSYDTLAVGTPGNVGQGVLVDEAVAAGAGVYLGQQRLLQLLRSVEEFARAGNPMMVTNQAYAAGARSVLGVTQVGGVDAVMKAGTLLFVWDRLAGQKVRFRLTTDEVINDSDIGIEDPDNPGQPVNFPNGLEAGQGIYWEARDLARRVMEATKNPMTTRGDLIVGGAGGVPGRLPVGTDNQVLVADSAAPLGVRWGNFSGGGGEPAPPFVVPAAVPGPLYLPTGYAMANTLNLAPVLYVDPATIS